MLVRVDISQLHSYPTMHSTFRKFVLIAINGIIVKIGRNFYRDLESSVLN